MVESRVLYRETPLYKTLSNSHYNDKVAIITFKTAAESEFCLIGPPSDKTSKINIPTKKTDKYYVMGLGIEITLRTVEKGVDGKYMEYCVKLDNIEKANIVSKSPKSKSKSPSKSVLRSKSKGGRSKKHKTRKSHKKTKTNKK